MGFEKIANVQISLETTPLSRAGFGTPIFIGSHNWFTERVRSYTSIEAVAADIPTYADEYKAALGAFSQSPSVDVFKIGRRQSSAELTPSAPSDGLVYDVTVTVDDGSSVVVSVTATALDTEETIVDAIKAAIDADAAVAAKVTTTKNGAGTAATLTIAPTTSTDSFSITNLSELTPAFTSTETAADVIAAIEVEDGDFWFVTAHDHSEQFVLDMASTVEAKTKSYFVSLADTGALGVLASPATDIAGKLKENNYLRTAWLFHQDADTSFPETAYVGRFAWTTPGTNIWSHKVVSGVSASKDPTTGKPLTDTQKTNISNRNGNIIESNFGVDIVRDGKTVGGEWIDVIRSRDFMEARLEEAIFDMKLKAGKIPYDSTGRAKLLSVVESTLSKFITTSRSPNILDAKKPYTLDFPPISSMTAQDKANRTYTASFTAYLSGAIQITKVNGVLTYNVG